MGNYSSIVTSSCCYHHNLLLSPTDITMIAHREEFNAGENLLVDFPSRSRASKKLVSSGLKSSGLSSETAKRSRGVHFSTHNQLVNIPIPSSEENKARWHSSKSKKKFKKVLINDVRRMAEVLSSTSSDDDISTCDLNACVGIEIFLSHGLANLAREKRKMHTNSILNEQSRQQKINIRDDDRLSRVSERSSRWSRDRSHDLAVGYWEIMDD